MNILQDQEKEIARKYVNAAKEIALKSTCLRAHCGAVIVSNDQKIGEGYNSPPLEDESSRMCSNVYENLGGKKLKYDRTCCIHAEWRAIIDALKHYPDELAGSSLYFMRIEDAKPIKTEPFCTVCSRLIMEVGIKSVILWQKEGYIEYEVAEYNKISYDFFL